MLDRLARLFGRRRAPAPRTLVRRYEGALVNRLTAGWRASITSIDTDVGEALPLLRARARDLCANKALGKRFLALVRKNVVGPNGFSFACRAGTANREGRFVPDVAGNAAVELAWAEWGRVGTCDVTGRLSFRQICGLVATAAARDGEALVRRIKGYRGNKFGYALQLLDPDLLDVTLNAWPAPRTGGNSIKMGVEVDTYGRPVAYHLLTQHPSEGAFTRERVPADQIFHLFLPDRPEQTRGVPWLHAILMSTHQLLAFEDAATVAARIGASKMGFFKTNVDPQEAAALMASARESGTAKPGDPQDPLTPAISAPRHVMDVEPGVFDMLPPGWDLATFDAAFPDAAFEPFVKSLTRRIASGLDVAYHNLTGDMTDVNYSSARIAELDERDGWQALQSWMIESFVEPAAREWLEFALLGRAIVFPSGKALGADADRDGKFSSALAFRGRRWSWVDPQKEIDAHVRAIQNGLRSRTAVVADEGLEFEDVVAQLAAETEALDAAEVPYELPKTGGNAAPPAPDPDPAVAA